MLVLAAALSAAVVPPACAPIVGERAVLALPRRYILFGEIHGTIEAPAMFGDLICAASQARPVMIGLEIPVGEQALLNAYLASPGDAAAKAKLLGGDHWHNADGRSSRAMLALIDWLRVLRQAGRVSDVVAFAPAFQTGWSDNDYNRAMAQAWLAIAAAHPRQKLLILVGNIHAMTHAVSFDGGASLDPAGAFLPRAATVTLGPADAGGVAYNCQQNGCGPHPAGAGSQPWPRSIRPVAATNRAASFDYLFAPGRGFTASPPVQSPAGPDASGGS